MHKLTKRHMEQVLQAESDFNQLLKACPYNKTTMLSRRRDADVVNWREVISCELYRMGYSFPTIGKVMNRDHTSIYHLVKKRSKNY